MREVANRARADTEAAHKRQRDEQQQAHRRQTDQIRDRHSRDRDSFRRNEIAAIERHAAAIKGLDNAEKRALAMQDKQHKTIGGRIAGLVPGSGRARDTERQAIRDRYEADRMKTHRDQEALKERQFQKEQATRLEHARERLAAMGAHREGREMLQQRQEAERPRLVEERQHALVAAKEHDRAQERQHSQAHTPTLDFNRVR